MKKVLSRDEIEHLQDIKYQIGELLSEARMIVRDTSEEQRATGYWLAHMAMALDDDHSYLGRSMVTFQSTIDTLEEEYLDGDRAEAVE